MARIEKTINPQIQIMRLFISAAMKYRLKTITAVSNSALTVIIGSFVGPYIISLVLTQLQAGTITLENSLSYIMIYSFTQIYGEIIGWRINLFNAWRMEVAAQKDLYATIFTQLTQQSLSFHGDRFGGALVSQTTKFIGAFERFWDTGIFQLMPTVASIAAAVAIMSFIFWQYAIFLVIISVIFGTAVFYGSKFMATRTREEAQASTASNAHIADTITNVMTIKSYGHENLELATLSDRTEAWRQKSLSTMRAFLGVSSVYSSLLAIINVGALVAAVWASEHHLASVGVIYLAITYTFTVARQLWEMNNIMRNYNRIMGDAHDMTQILQLSPLVKDHTTHVLEVTKGEVEFKAISFHHEEDPSNLFEDFSLSIKPGQRVGLVGPSGSGKTTITKLLLRFSDIQHGEICIDGQSIKDVTQESLRKKIAYVPQEPMLFHRTLRENIAYGKPDATEKEIITAATQANAIAFIKSLPQGFDTLVGERGVKLSGGQRQRIAIARAILKDAPILVLDEATSALDSESEMLVQDSLQTLMRGRTSIVIAHRLSTIAKLDRIIVLDNGKIVEDGTHSKLLTRKGIYSKLWGHQSGGFIED